jgi:hypothetical protein
MSQSQTNTHSFFLPAVATAILLHAQTLTCHRQTAVTSHIRHNGGRGVAAADDVAVTPPYIEVLLTLTEL